jgi:hypothetical protein
MADNQMVKIVFDFDLGNVPASAKKLSQYLKDNSLDLKFTKASVDGLSASLGQLSTQQNKAGNSVKKSNQQWTNFALILQDLPYGFRGIQNNLPAVIGGLAGMTGPIYLITSAIIALFTALDSGIIKFSSTLSSAEIQQKTFNDVLEKSKDSYAEVKTQVMLLNDQVAEAAGKKDLEKKAVKDYNDTLGDSLGKLNTFKEVQDSLISQGDKYIDYIFKLNMANTAAGKVAEESANMMIASLKKPQDFVGGWDKFWSVQFNMFGNLVDATTGTAKKMYDAGKQNQQEAIKGFGKSAVAAEEVMKIFRKQAQDAKALLKFGSFDNKKSTSVKTLQDPNIALLEAKKQYYKDDLLMSASFEQEILARQGDLVVRQAELEGKSDKNIQTIKDTYNQLILNSQAETGKKIIEEQHKLGVEEAKEHEKVAQMILNTRFDLANGIAKINSDFAKEDIKNVEAGLSSTLKATKGNYNAQAAAIQASIDKINAYKTAAIEAGYGTAEYEKELEKLKATLEGLVDPLEQMEININNTLNSLASGALVELGTQIGNVFSGSAFSLDGFLSMLGDGLIQIGTYLVSISTVFVAIKKLFESGGAFAELAIPIGLAAIATGVVIKNKLVKQNTPKFANGGIVSGPTMGLMGEYPGAQSNPEVIAPLDKLKSMIGGGGNGEFVLRGNDLVLALQRSNSSLNLRRGGI